MKNLYDVEFNNEEVVLIKNSLNEYLIGLNVLDEDEGFIPFQCLVKIGYTNTDQFYLEPYQVYSSSNVLYMNRFQIVYLDIPSNDLIDLYRSYLKKLSDRLEEKKRKLH